jgi:diacylglycerol O-acyltransferase
MTDRLSPLDVSLLYLETPTTAMHLGSVATFDAPEGQAVDYDALCDLVEHRIGNAPRYRQKVRFVPGHLANPVWVDDEDFDITYHVRRSALPRPGSVDQLRELVGRVQSRQLDRDRPLWELYLVEGLTGGGFAIITKTHQALADGSNDITALVLDPTPTPRETPGDGWLPDPEPSGLDLVLGAVIDNLRRPTEAIDTVRAAAGDVRATAGRVLHSAGGLLTSFRTSLRPAPTSPLNVRIGEQRRFAMAATDLDVYRRVRKAHGGTVNDVVLATVAGALRTWLLTRGESVLPSTVLRALVPVSVRPDDAQSDDVESGSLPVGDVAPAFVDLPIGEPNPVVRLHQVSYAMRAHVESGRSVSAGAITGLSGFAPPRVHSVAARLATRVARRLFNVVVTNVPGPQFPLYAVGAQMTGAYPVVPLVQEQAVAVGLTSYNGGVFYGLNADRDALPDVDVIAQCIEEALDELEESVR